MKQAVKKKRSLKSVKLLDSSDIGTQLKKLNLQRWLQAGYAETKPNLINGNNRNAKINRPDSPTQTPVLSEKVVVPREQWSIEKLVHYSLCPAVSDPEMKEYERYGPSHFVFWDINFLFRYSSQDFLLLIIYFDDRFIDISHIP